MWTRTRTTGSPRNRAGKTQSDLFARYREMGAMGPQPLDEHGFLFNETENVWTYSINDNFQDAIIPNDNEEKQEPTIFKPSCAFSLTSEGDHVKVSSDKKFEELIFSPHRIGLNLNLLKNNNICNEYYKLTSNMLRSLILGIKEIATDEITLAWHTEFPQSPKKCFSNLLVNKLNKDVMYPNFTSIHTIGKVGISKLSSFNCPTKLATREVINIPNLRRWLWNHPGHPRSYLSSTSLVNKHYIIETINKNNSQSLDQEQTICETQLAFKESSYESTKQMTSSELTDCTPQANNTENSTNLSHTTNAESTNTNISDEIPTQSNCSQTPITSTIEDDEALTKPCTNSEFDHEHEVRKICPIKQTISENKQFIPLLHHRNGEEKPIRHIEENIILSRKQNVPIRCKSRENEGQESNKKSKHTTMVARNIEAFVPTRTKSWCLVGGYVKRFPANHQHTLRKIQHPSKNRPQVPLAA